MKNPFKKEDHTSLMIGIAVGVAAGISLGWLFLTDEGSKQRRYLVKILKNDISDEAAKIISKKTIVPKKAAKVATDAGVK